MRRTVAIAAAVPLAVAAYFSAWPVPVDPVAWEAPPNAGFTGAFAVNTRLQGAERLSIGAHSGPEDVAVDSAGRIYVSTREGAIVRLSPDGSAPEVWARTGGRPLGLAFGPSGELMVADGVRGLLSVSPSGEVAVLATEADGVPIGFADDLDLAADGKVYFSDASVKFGVGAAGTFDASLLDILEHGGHGRLLVYDPATRRATTVVKGLNFANGVAVSPDQQYLLLNETGHYRVLRVWLEGPRRGSVEPLIEHLPGFPDNLTAGHDGRFWVALYAPRNALLDRLSARPALRKVILRIPEIVRPRAAEYGHVFAIDGDGRVVADLQDPTGAYPTTTSALETADYLYVGSLTAPVLARVRKTGVAW